MRKFRSRVLGKTSRATSYSAEQSTGYPTVSTPNSAVSAQTSANASAAAATLVEFLGEDIDLFDLASVSEVQHARLRQLKAVGESWPESSQVNVDARGVTAWSADPETARLVQIACHVSNAVRPTPSDAPPRPRGVEEFVKIGSHASSMAVKKVISLYYCGVGGEGVVVVCVRAGGSWGDWVINTGFNMTEVERDFIDIEPPARTTIGSSSRSVSSHHPLLFAHAGFLSAAIASLSSVASAIQEAIRARPHPITRILFAGHSAGGAVAGLFFSHFASCASRYPFLNQASVSLNLITFGAPPILSWNITPQIKALLPPSSILLAFVIEGDPVPKLDMNYMVFLADSLRQVRPLLSKQVPQQRSFPPPIPPLTLHTLGSITMFRDLTEETEETDENSTMIFVVEEDIFGRAAWVNLCRHFMFNYLDMVAIHPGLGVGLM